MSTGMEAILSAVGGGGGAPPEAPAAAPEGGEPSDIYKQVLELLSAARAAEDNENDRLQIEKVTTLIQQLLASEEKELNDAMQGKMSPGLLSRAYGG